MADRKIFAGPRIRRMRTGLGLSQSAMAGELGISPSYLNLIERNQRPLTVQILLKLSSTYDVDIGELQGDEGGETTQRLREVFSDPLLIGELPSPAEMLDAAEATPNVARSLVKLFDAWRETTDRLSDLSGLMARGETAPATATPLAQTPFTEVAAFLESADPWVPELESAAMRIGAELSPRDDMFGAIKARLRDLHAMDIRVLPGHAMPYDRARLDRHSQRIFLSEHLSHEEKVRFAAIELALVGEADLLDRLAGEAALSSREAERLIRMAYARRLAAAILMPADRLLRAAAELRYDIARLARRFAVSPLLVMERLAHGRDPEAQGPEFFHVALDAAGTVMGRTAGAGFPMPRTGALCARLPLFDRIAGGGPHHDAIAFEDGSAWMMIVAGEPGPDAGDGGPPPRRLAAIGCTVEAAGKTVYDVPDGSARPRPAGPTCRLCERRACPARTRPAATRPAALNDHALGMSDFDPA